MATLNITTALEYTQDGVAYTVGSKTVPVQVTYSNGLSWSGSKTVAASTSATLLTIGTGAISAATAIAITCDKDFAVQLEGAAEANNSTMAYDANTFCVLTQGQIYTYDANSDFGSTVKVNIIDINVRNEDAAASGTFRWWIWN